MKDLMKRRIFPSAVCGGTSPSDFIYGVDPLGRQLRSSRFGGLPPEKLPNPDTVYDEDDSELVDPTIDPSLDRFQRTERIISQISDRMKSKKRDELEKAEV